MFPGFYQQRQNEATGKKVNVDFTLDMIKELDAAARELNISRQAVIKEYLHQALDQQYLARQSPQ